jgi:hypothetical protein
MSGLEPQPFGPQSKSPRASSQLLELEGRRPAVPLDRCGGDPARTEVPGDFFRAETIRVIGRPRKTLGDVC